MRISDGSSDVCSSDLRDPAGLLAQFFLADVVRPAAAGLADAAAHDQHVDQAAVVHVVVEPVVHARADDDHAAAAGLVGGAGELTPDLDHVVARHPGDLFLPVRRDRNSFVEACCGFAPTNPPTT